ncbi:hypothetical protein GE09DRAFT_1060291 [Coniochaeta sp. 2T2.1]|nr:hypothetical protein GE09DRAFT_1060291 [Coniochaeta sp. 2T2.1]
MAENADAGEATLSFKVKTSGDKTHQITMSDSATVLDLKTKLAGPDLENIAVDRQRLIYSGRVMKNDDTLKTYKIKPGNTIHMVKSAASNPAPAPSTTSAPAAAAVPQNMAAGVPANNLLAGLTGARFAGHGINLPGAATFGADGGMGAPPNEDQIADMLSDPTIMATMQEYMNTPQFIDLMLQTNPMLANMPNAREMLSSPQFRRMMTDPESLRMAARMRNMMGGGAGGAGAFPAPGVTDNGPGGAPAGGNNNAANAANFSSILQALQGQGNNAFGGMGGFPGAPGATAAPGSNPTSPPAAGADTNTQPGAAQANPFAALFGGAPGAQGAGAANQNPFNVPGMPPITPEALQAAMGMFAGANPEQGAFPPMPNMTPEQMQQASQFMQSMMGNQGGFGGGLGNVPAAPADNRPPEERYAEQLRQLNDMGFFDFDRNVQALRRSGGSVQGAIEHLLSGS